MTDTYDLAPDPNDFDAPPGFVVRRDLDDLVDAIAADIYVHAQNCVRAFGDFHLALSGGQTPLPLYRRLMYDPRFRDLPWPRTHLWVTSASAHGEPVGPLVDDLIAQHADVPPRQRHTASEDAAAYAQELREHLGWREKGHDRLDCVILGVDSQGGVAGLTHGADLETDDLTAQGPGGHTLSLRMINASRFIAVVATGDEKRPVLASKPGAVARLAPLSGELRFYVDEAALPASENAS